MFNCPARAVVVAQSVVETFNDPVLPRRARFDLQRVGSAFFHHSSITSGMNSLPMSLRIFSAAPRIAVNSSSTIITPCDFIICETSSAIFSHVYSSSTTNILIDLPSAVRSKIKSMPYTWFLRVKCLRTMPDSADPILFFFGFVTLSDLPLARHAAVACDSRANVHDPISLACIANHVADACVRVRASALQDAFDMCSQ